MRWSGAWWSALVESWPLGKARQWTTAIVFLTLILILVLKPTGILGEALIEKV